MAGLCNKLLVILWKNALIRKRHWLLTILEIVIPVLSFLILVYIKKTVGKKDSDCEETTTVYPKDDDKSLMEGFPRDSIFLYSPQNQYTEELIERLRMKLDVVYSNVHGFSNPDELQKHYTNITLNDSFDVRGMYIIHFYGDVVHSENPKKLQYKLRTHNFFQTDSIYPTILKREPMHSSDVYRESSFLTLQTAIDLSFMELSMKKPNGDLPLSFSVQQFPYPSYCKESFFYEFYKMGLTIVMIFSFVLLCPALLKRIVEEKESGIKELMKMMGLKSWMIWFSWFINALIVNVVSVIIISIILKVDLYSIGESFLPLTNTFLLICFLLFYCIGNIFYCFFISSLFNKPIIAMCVGIFFCIVPYFSLETLLRNQKTSRMLHYLLSLIPSIAVFEGFFTITDFEARNVGSQWSNFTESPNGKILSLCEVFFIFIAEVILFSILTWYVSLVKPGNYGLALPFYFPFTQSYWQSLITKKVTNETISSMEPQQNCETYPLNLKPGIQIRNLYKTFGSKTAVDGLNLDIFEGEITALLGHNGAGKTTTVSIITGMFSLSRGSVYVNGYNVATEMDNIRDTLGLCPQHNLLFTDLTVKEHLLFFGKIKGMSFEEAGLESEKLLSSFQMLDKANKLSSTLSGGMKRKLCLGIALIGNSKLLILDEPTSGMDPEARREIWNLLLKMRGERTIIITTHFMEEADVLGDRIAIMDHGQLQCYGSSLFLKNLYGTGYQLSLSVSSGTDIQKITSNIKQHISDAKLNSHLGSLLTYKLPTNQLPKFTNLFKSLETNKKELGINSIGLSITTLEEVFLRVGLLARDNKTDMKYINKNDSNNMDKDVTEYNRIEGRNLIISWLLVLLKKRILFSYRKKFFFILMAIVPILLTIVISWQPENLSDTDEVELKLNLDIYGPTKVIYTSNLNVDSKRLVDLFKSSIPKSSWSQFVDKSEFENAVLEVSSSSEEDLRVIAGDMDVLSNKNLVLNGLYSSMPLHAAPVSLNMITNTALKYLKGSEYSISVTNAPISAKTDKSSLQNSSLSTVKWFLIFPIGLLQLVCSVIYFPLIERESNAKQLQLMAGVPSYIYWIPCFIWDITTYLVISVILVIIISIFGGGTFTSIEISIIFLILLMYGLSAIPYAYVFSYLRKTIGGAVSLWMVLNLVAGVILPLIVIVFYNADKKDLAETSNWILCLCPHYALSMAVFGFFTQVFDIHRCEEISKELQDVLCGDQNSTYICCKLSIGSAIYFDDFIGISQEMIMMFIDFIIFVSLIFMIDYNVLSRVCQYLISFMAKKDYNDQARQDEDVKDEIDRVDGLLNTKIDDDKNCILVAHDLKKRFGLSFMAVKGIYFGVNYGECFGLLGVNGAGKTTTFRMLTGDTIPTSGMMRLENYTIRENKTSYLSQIGYCPQFDAINEFLTGREMINTYAIIRGIPDKHLHTETQKWLSKLDLLEHADYLCETYSGGNKRKLSTALALIGDPKVLLLDEPTSGVDPIARRNLWDILAKVKKSGQSIVLTSHSMEECEALCDRLAIMVNGQFVCIGSTQYLKKKFCQGFTIMIKLIADANSTIVNDLKKAIEKKFTCKLRDEHPGLLNYQVTDTSTKWYELFKGMEDLKIGYSTVFEDYTVSDTTLEEIFISFAVAQKNKSPASKRSETTSAEITAV